MKVSDDTGLLDETMRIFELLRGPILDSSVEKFRELGADDPFRMAFRAVMSACATTTKLFEDVVKNAGAYTVQTNHGKIGGDKQ